MTGQDPQIAEKIARAMQQAITLHQRGRTDQAIPIYRRILETLPEHVDAMHLMGLALRQQGDTKTAIACLEKAVALQPGVAAMHSNLGNAYRDAGQDEQALAQYLIATDRDPRHQDAWYNLGNVYRDTGKPDQAIRAYDEALAINSADAQALHNKAIVLQGKQRIDLAIAGFTAAIQAKPGFAAAHHHLGIALDEAGQHDAAIRAYQTAVQLEPGSQQYWVGLARAIQFTEFNGFDANLKSLMLSCFEHTGLDHQHLAVPALSLVRHDPRVSAAFTLSRDWVDKPDASVVIDDLLHRLDDPLLLALLGRCILADENLETLLVACRSALLDVFDTRSRSSFESSSLCEALARQCWLNEYVWPISESEQATAEKLASNLEITVRESDDVPIALFVLASYAPLPRWFDTSLLLELAQRTKRPVLQDLVRMQITEPQTEKVLAKDMTCLGDISDEVSIAVRSQYEENPYPRWTVFTKSDAKTVGDVMNQVFPGRAATEFTSPSDPRLLIAGCGTGRNAFETASRFAGAKTLAIDLSKASLSYARRKADELGIDDIEFAQADLLSLGALDERYDVIDCSGVLHHMARPEQGLAVLYEILKTGGVMRLGLYSELSRQPVVVARNLINEHGYKATTDGIRRCRQTIFSLDSDHPARPVARSRDFFSMSLCRDLLFHVQEHRYTLPQIKCMLDELQLEFLGFEPGFAGIRRKYLARYADDANMTNLDNWHAHEKQHTDSFIGMYQFWLRKN